MGLLPGTRLGPYEILAPLGAGGMGEVYRAKDPRLGREVAIKVLPPSLSNDSDRLRRFELEAKAASALNHPNILTIHDIGTHDSAPYVVSELLEGGTLRDLLVPGPLPATRAVALALQLARGLAAAHEKGIVHRDVKPANLFVTKDGRLKILDFGLARVVPVLETGSGTSTDAGTSPGTVLGTTSYMSPEQVRGRPTDARSDLFSAGVVLYEMLAGGPPFQADSPVETMHAILWDEPPPLSSAARRVPAALERLIGRCLEKDPDLRFQHAQDFAYALESVGAEPLAAAPAASRGPARRSLAVLLFKDLAGDPANAHLGLGLADATITELASMKSLLVRPTAAILRLGSRAVEPEDAGRQLGVDAVVVGNFQRSGSRLRVTVQLIDVADGRPLWGTKIDTSLQDLFGMQDEVSRQIARALAVEFSPSDEHRVAPDAAPSGRAYELYLKGRLHLSADTTLQEVNSAIECFEKALELDPDFAHAQLGLADAYTRMNFSFDPEGDWYERAEAMCGRILAARPDLPEGHYLRGRLLWHPRRGFDHAGALREFAAAIAGRPGLTEAHHFYGQICNHVGLLPEANEAFERALALDPQDGYAGVHLAQSRYLEGRWSEALNASERFAASAPSPWIFYLVALCELRLGPPDRAAASLKRASRLFPGSVLLFSVRGLMASLSGDSARAREQVELIVRNRKAYGHYHHAQYDVACIEALLGGRESALDWLTEAARNGFPCVSLFETDPWLEPLRSEERFERLLAELRTEREGYRQLL